MPRKVLATAVAVFCLSYLTIDLLRRLSLTVNSSQFLRLSQLRPSAARSAIPGLLKFHSNQSDADMTVYAQQTKERSQFLGEISVCSAIIKLYIICMWITRCNNHDLYNGACGMFGNTGMIIHINATLTCVGLNAFCTHLIPGRVRRWNNTANDNDDKSVSQTVRLSTALVNIALVLCADSEGGLSALGLSHFHRVAISVRRKSRG